MTAEPEPEEPAVLEQFLTCMSCEDLFKFAATVERFEAEIAQLPTDWTVRICGLLEYLRDYGGPLGADLQTHALGAFVPEPLRKDLLKHHRESGRLFLYEEQLLGVMKFAIIGGTAVVPDVMSAAQQKAFFWALMLYGDLHSKEGPVENTDDAARLEMRGLTFAARRCRGT